MAIEQQTVCDASRTAHVTYRMTGPAPTYNGQPIAATGTVSVPHTEHVSASVLADGETYAVLNGWICPEPLPIVLAQTGAATEAMAGIGGALAFLGVLCALASIRLRRRS